MSKFKLFLPLAALGAAGFAYKKAIDSNKEKYPDYPKVINKEGIKIEDLEEAEEMPKEIKEKKRMLLKRKPKSSSSKISRYLQKILNTIDNNRMLLIEIKPENKKDREELIQLLESLITEEPVDEMWVAELYTQSRSDIYATANKKAIFYLSNLDEVAKVRVSAKTATAKLMGSTLSKLSSKYPSMEKYFFEPMLDIYAPLKETEEIANFGIVKERMLYRGGMPVGEQNYDQLAELGIKTVVNLKIEDSAVEYVAEQNSLLARNINLHYMPMPNVAEPTMHQALEFLNLVYNTETSPVYAHCHRGADRTGVVSAIYRITEGQSAAKALVEANKYNIASNFHTKKIDFIYKFEQEWLKWKEAGKLPQSFINFDFLSLIDKPEEEIIEAVDTEEIEKDLEVKPENKEEKNSKETSSEA